MQQQKGAERLREKIYPKTITFRLTRSARNYIIQRAKLEDTTMTRFLRKIVFEHWTRYGGSDHLHESDA
jgi:hypothetical protein